MKSYSLLFLLLLVVGSLGAQKVIKDQNAESRTVSGFHAIRISGAFDVIITQGNEDAVVVSSNHSDDVKDIKTVVENGALRIWFDKKDSWWGKNRKLKAYISAKSLSEVRASGASRLYFEGAINSSNLKLDLSGASKVEGRLVVSEKLSIDLSGASDAKLSGMAGQLSISASGASDVNGYDLQTSNATVSASGASDITVTVDKELSASLSGASKLRYKGTAVVKDIRTSGASTISRRS
jgi:hypothetical protein